MKMITLAGALLVTAVGFLCQAHAVELCEPQDYYNLLDSKECKLEYEKAGHKSDPREAMFEIMKNYPYENKDRFLKLMQRKIDLVDIYMAQQQGQTQTEVTKANLNKLEQTKHDLMVQKDMVQASTQTDWEPIRDQARKVLEEASKRLLDVEAN